jgi:HPt (histidine-containing phosphotransfer) domain-containing protein
MSFFKSLPAAKQEQLLQAFGRDARKAIITLRESFEANDITSLTSTFHSMKSALANIGEEGISDTAQSLERAGKNGDMEFISANIGAFIQTLEGLLHTEHTVHEDRGTERDEDTEFVIKQLGIIKSACDDCDDETAYSALDALLDSGKLKIQTREFVQRMHNLLYSDSDFDGVSEEVSAFLRRYKK